MQKDDSIMRYEPVLPEDFTGTFYLSNPTDEDFTGVWAGKQYLFPAGTMSAIMIPEHSPIEIQHIRKHFARALAEREFYKSKGYAVLRGQEGTQGNRNLNSIHQAAAYTIKDLEPYILEYLKPLPVSKLLSKRVESVPLEEKLHKNDEGEPMTQAIDKKSSLREKALKA
jgi:hypothetical protein